MDRIGFYPFEPNQLHAFPKNRVISIYSIGEFEWEINGKKITNRSSEFDSYLNEKYELIIQELKLSEIIFCRHYDIGPRIELIYRELALVILSLSESLKSNSVKYVVFFTGSSHHIDSLICELACRIAGITQIFLYHIFFLDRLIPMFQTQGISTRTASKKIISTHSFESQILSFSTDKLGNFNQNIDKHGKSFIMSLFLVTLKAIRRQIRNLIQFIILKVNKRNNLRKTLDCWSLTTTYSLLISHKKANRTLRDLILEDVDKIVVQESENFLVIFAHLEPEATNFPEGGRLHNIIDLVINIRSLGYKKDIIYKEHPAFKFYSQHGNSARAGVARNVDFYKQLRSLGCIFVNDDYLVNEGSIVITLTGTIALERSSAGKQTVILGNIWFNNLPGSITLKSAIEMTSLSMSSSSSSSSSSSEIELNAKKFLLDCVNYTTINNARGIGSGIASKNASDWEEYYSEINKLITYLMT